MATTSYNSTPNLSIKVGGVAYAYRDLGSRMGVPLVLFNHWGAVLDDYDPAIVDALARSRRVIATNYRGVGASGGQVRASVEEMARDAIDLIRALGFDSVDLFGFSLGGMVAQDIALRAPELVRRLILVGTGPAGGKGIGKFGAVPWILVRGFLTMQDPKHHLFFPNTPDGQREAKDFVARIKERTVDRDQGPRISSYYRQLQAITAWGQRAPQDLGRIKIPVLITNGDNDIMVPTENSVDMAHRIPQAQLVIYENAGHGGHFQCHEDFVATVLPFLEE
ncbi:alpha/beta hydrolase fold protein [Acaromyces ingoldii]|uniref:Alpha/beta hydrolase fold protein n=1 Tax=Acaromyces ingoldii TaxID=215250 RepID=A0A316YKJ1_9BASI|nr:alpha/beta hydrolase fold protein [Acaromyces ingoldii]PWN89729.1 alpha/beta hydrolase fold protein [Acaromyces ingoldii]